MLPESGCVVNSIDINSSLMTSSPVPGGLGGIVQ